MNRRNIIKSALGFLGLGGAALAESTQSKEPQKANNEISFKKEDKIYYLKNNELYLVETFSTTFQHKEVLIARHWYKNGLLHRDEDLPAEYWEYI
ncbi:MAG: hypothetical protein WCG45_05600 [bacterium]